jgi:hypothetical protein
MNPAERLRRIEHRVRRSAQRGDERHHEIDQMLQSNDQIRAQLVAVFSARLDQVEANTARITSLEEQLAQHVADKKGHQK